MISYKTQMGNNYYNSIINNDKTKISKRGLVKIENIWEKNLTNTYYVYVLVSYENTSFKSYNNYVTIKASLKNKERIINTSKKSFFASEYGAIDKNLKAL